MNVSYQRMDLSVLKKLFVQNKYLFIIKSIFKILKLIVKYFFEKIPKINLNLFTNNKVILNDIQNKIEIKIKISF